MDTPDPGVVKDSQQLRSNVTPKSAAFGSPIATQDSWTAPPRRRQVKQKAKASFLPDDDGDDNHQDEQNDDHAVTNPREQSDGGHDVDFISYDFDSARKGESEEDREVYNQSPTPHTFQAARLPPQSAQPIPRSNATHSSDKFSVFEALKKQPAAAVASKIPSKIPSRHEPSSHKLQQGLVTRDKLPREGEEGSPVRDNPHRPKSSATKSLANSKVKLAALEVEGETETEIRMPGIQESIEDDYSLPASNSSSPAAAPAKKKAPTKKQAVKKAPPKPKAISRGAKASTRGRARKAKAAPGPPVEQSTEAQPDEERNEDMLPADEPSIVSRPPQEASPPSQVTHRKLELRKSVTEVQKKDVVMKSSDPFSSFPESDNADDEDFECSRKMTPGNARRRTRAVAADSAAAKGTKKKAENQPAALVNARRHDAEDQTANLDADERPKRQSKPPTMKTAIEKTQTTAPQTESKSESAKEMKLSAEKSKKKASTNERTAASTRNAKDKSEVKQETVMSSNSDRVAKGEAKKHYQVSEPVKETKESYRKPNVVAFGPKGPKTNGRSQKPTAIIDSRSSGQQLGPNNGDYLATAKSQPSKGAEKAARSQLNRAVKDGDNPTNDFIGHAESDFIRASRADQSTVARIDPDKGLMADVDGMETVPEFDEETTTLVYEAEPDDTFTEFVAGDAEADTAVDLGAHLLADTRDYQARDVENDSQDNGDGRAFNPFAQADTINYLDSRGQRTILGETDTNYRTSPKDSTAVIYRPMKRKGPDTMNFEEGSPNQQALPSKTDSQLGCFPTLRMNSATLNMPSGDPGRAVKKPRYNSVQAVRVNEDSGHDSNPVGEPGGLFRGVGGDTGDDVFGPGKKSEPSGSSAFVQRLISNESAHGGFEQAAWMAPDSRDGRAAPRQQPITSSHPDKARFIAPGNTSRPQRKQEPDDVEKRMLEALGPKKVQAPRPWSPSGDSSKGLFVGDRTKSSLRDTFDQKRASDVDERTRAWKKATEPYANSVGETMHRIVNTILRGLKTNEAAINDVIDDYRTDGRRVVDRIADRHSKERLVVSQQQEQYRLQCVQNYRQGRHVAGTFLDKLESVDVDRIMAHLGKDAVTNRLKQLQQTLTDA